MPKAESTPSSVASCSFRQDMGGIGGAGDGDRRNTVRNSSMSPLGSHILSALNNALHINLMTLRLVREVYVEVMYSYRL